MLRFRVRRKLCVLVGVMGSKGLPCDVADVFGFVSCAVHRPGGGKHSCDWPSV